MRDWLLVFHRWLALVTTIIVLVLAITGSALVFEGAMDRGMHPELWRVTPGTQRVSIDTLVAHARSAAGKAPITGVTLPAADDRAAVISAGPTQVFLDPYTGAVKGTRSSAEANATLPRRLHVLHVQLMAGKTGNEVAAAVTAACLLLVLTGLILWWPDKIVRVRWSASWKRILFDLHHASGVLSAIILVLITGSGVVMHYKPLNEFMYSFDREAPAKALDQSRVAGDAPQIPADSLLAVATRALPGANVMFLTMPPKRDQPFVAAMRFPEDHTPGGRSRVVVDRFTGGVLLATSTRNADRGTRMGNAIRSVHTGDLYGKPTEVIWLLAALAMGTQAVSGVSMWWNGRKGRSARKARDRALVDSDAQRSSRTPDSAISATSEAPRSIRT